ncbi:SWIM zinc finger family protein [Xanthocytophaga agilis]|uniref:SWIM zinc finger family protein n=1 Tax=Xanthocytophaga agilis TaxID=3048010 RepID=A0AAE3R2G8_9BACT|nr:SWIM zinc finger family protein [Xanthocytophaga agilis]MDJ1502631.1 SWIM zinc finger family protein [Xanthocytophaga agilis]
MNQLTEEQIAQLSPDTASLAAGKGLAGTSKWVSFAYNERVLWGEIKGSGSTPYRSQIDLTNTAFKCSCPSRKFPCKHGLGLYLMFTRNFADFTKTENEPVWVKEWMDKRASKPATTEPKPEADVETVAKQAKAKEKRQNKRLEEIAGGVAELDLWVKDLLRGGLLAFPEKGPQFWKKTAARMVDAKAPGLGNMVKEFQEINYFSGNTWQGEALQQATKIFMLLEGVKNIDALPTLVQEDVKSLIGISRNQKELLEDAAAEKIKDIWLVLGRQREVNDEDLTIQRDWLYGTQSKRFALILNFAYRSAPIQNLVVPGTATQAELVFYPGNYPLRAAIKMVGSNSTQFSIPEMFGNWDAVQEYYTQILSKFPWADNIPLFVKDLLPVTHASKWHLRDSDGYIMPLPADFDIQKLYQILAISGGASVHMSFLRQKDTVVPLGVWVDGKYKLI